MKKLAVGLASLALVAAACSSSSKSSTGGSGASGGGGSSNKAPVKIALLDFETGTYATPDRHNAVELAIKQINAAGGADGHMFQYTPYDTGILPQTTVTAVDKAVSDGPTAILGLAVSSGVQASASMLKSSGIPTIQEGQDNTTDLSVLGVTNMFRGQPSVTEQSQSAVNYLTSLHPTTVGLFDDSDLNSVAAMKTIKAGLQAHGVNNFIYREIAQTAGDATEAALSMKGASVVTSDGFPVQESVFVRALASNGVGVHDLMGNSGLVIAGYGLAPWSAIAGNSTYTICDPLVLNSTAAKNYVADYRAAYPTADVTLSNPVMYDAVWMIAKAIEAEKGDISHAGIVKGLEQISYTGVCEDYHSDSQHTLAHTMFIVQFGSAKGAQSLVARYDNMASR
jgi:branched-chain amino acid transport system substrate-binding protein